MSRVPSHPVLVVSCVCLHPLTFLFSVILADMFERYGPVVREEALWQIPVVSVLERSAIETVLRSSTKYPLRPPTEVTSHYRRSRPDRYTNLGLVNE